MTDTHRAIDAVWRIESARLIAGLARIALYAELARLTPSPVVELNRAVAAGMAFGPQAGLDLVDALTAEPALRGYHLLPAVRGDLLAKLGRSDEARAEFERAAGLTRNGRERELLLERARSCAGASRSPQNVDTRAGDR